MVSYDIYKNRIQKIAAVKNFIVKFRILFISAICLILAATTAFLIMKGMVVDGLSLPAQIIYGDTFQPEGGKALFSDVKYEYAYITQNSRSGKSAAKTAASDEVGLVWTSEKPDKAGSYYVRTVTQKSFGITGYGTPVRFEIQPKTVEFLILDDAVIYGTNPDEYVFKLVGNDRLIATGLLYDFESFEATITNVCAKAESVKVVDGDGNDVTYCYDIVTPEKEVRLVERKITVTPEKAEFVYDGSAVDYAGAASEETVRALGEGDTINITTVIKDVNGEVIEGTPVLAGTYTVEVTSVSIFKGQTDVTERYGITNAESTLIIGRRPVKITTSSASREYNGKPLTSAAFEASGLVEGHFAQIASKEVSITYAGSVLNEYTFAVYGGETDFTENYDITYDYGTLSVQPRRVTLTTPDAQKIYDGTQLWLTEGYTLSDIAEGDTESLVSYPQITEVGSKANALLFMIYNGEGVDVTSSYSVNNQFGTLTVTPRLLVITTGSAEKVYDGLPVYGDTAEGLVFDNLIDGSTYSAYGVTEIVDAGFTTNETKYKIFFNGIETTSNYEITYICGILNIEKRALTITTGSAEKVYDGQPLTGSAATYGLAFDGIVDGERGVAEVLSARTDVGVSENQTTYKIYSAGLSEDKETTENYLIEYNFAGTLTVTVRPVTVTTATSHSEYNGEKYIDTSVAAVENLLDYLGHTLEVDQTKNIAYVTAVTDGEVENEVYYTVKDADGNFVTDNYDITYIYGVISVTPRVITAESNTSTWIYDGTAHYDWGCTAYRRDENDALVLNHTVSVISYPDITDVGNVENIVEIKIIEDDTETDVSENYYIQWTYGKLTVTQREITIITGTAEKVYDGKELLGHGGEALPQFENLAENQTAQADFIDRMLNVLHDGENVAGKENRTTYKIYSGEIETTANYSITYEYGTLKITPRPVTITTGSDEKEYDGTPLYGHSEKAQPVFENVLQGEPWLISYNYSITEVPDSEQKLNKTQYSLGINNSNYDITYIYGTLNILPRKITVTTATDKWEYDGEAHSNTGWTAERLLGGHTLKVDGEYSFVTNVNEGDVKNVVAYTVTAADGRDISKNYKIEYVYGTISVYARTIYVTTATVAWEYDGKPHGNTMCTEERLLTSLGHALKVDGEKYSTVTNVYDGEVENRVEYRVFDWFEGGNDISYNYNIVYKYGKIWVTPREITVTTSDGEWEYDGAAHFNENYKVSRINNEKPLVLDHKIEITSHTEIIDVDSVYNVLDCIVVSETDERANENYNINYSYGTLTVTQRKITVTTGTQAHVYDGQPFTYTEEIKVQNLLNYEPFNHKIELDESRREEFASVTFVTDGEIANKLYVKVLDGEKDVSYNYDIDYVWGKISITKRSVTITTATMEKEYDGNALYGNSVDPVVENIVAGEETVCDSVAEMTDVLKQDGAISTTENSTTYKIYSGETETTENYDIKYIKGTLKITPRPITITTEDAEWIYDGTYHKGDGLRISYKKADGKTEYGLVSEDHCPIVDEVATIRDVGSKENYCIVVMIISEYDFEWDGTITDFTDNYVIEELKYGTLTVNPRPITITTGTKLDEEYNGLPFSYTDGAEGDNLAPDQVIKVDESRRAEFSTVTNVELEAVNNYVYFIIEDAQGIDVTSNYTVSYKWGKINRRPKEITVKTGSAEKVYDGKRLQKLDEFEASWLFTGHEFVLDESRKEEFASATNVYNPPVNNQLYFKVQLQGGTAEENEVANRNYKIVGYVLGTLTILPKAVTITTQSHTQVYDGTPLIGTYFDDTKFDDEFIQNTFTAINSPQITDVGKVQNAIIYDVYDGELKTTANYSITYVYGYLEVTARPLVITTGTSLEKEYDGTPLTYADGASGDNLVDGHTLAVDESRRSEFAFVTEVEILDKENIVYYLVKDGEKDVTSNYEIEYSWGKINRTPRKIVITTGSDTKIYDGEPLTCTDKNTADRLVGMVGSEIGAPIASHRVVVVPDTNIPSITDVGTVTNQLVCTVVRADGTDVSHNYDITDYIYGTLEVTPRHITITTGSKQKIYDGKPLFNAEATADNLVKDHKLLAITAEVSITDVGNAENKYEFDVYDGERKVTHNYEIKYNYGRLVIDKRPITVELNPTPDTVYGTPYMQYVTGLDKYANAETVDLVNGEKLIVTGVKYYYGASEITPKDAGTYKVVAELAISGGQGKITNYQVTQLESSFTIKKLTVTVTLTQQTGREYDGLDYSFPVTAFTSTATAYGEVLTVGVDYFTSAGVQVSAPQDADTYTVKLNEDKCYIGGNVPATRNYELKSAGVITYEITPRVITVTTGGKVWVYDGAPHSFGEATPYHVASGGEKNALVSDHELKLGTLPEITFVGTKDNEFTCTVTSSGKDVTHNYDISQYIYGQLEITPKPITVTVFDKTEEYTGEAITYGAEDYDKSGFENEDSKNAIYKYTYVLNGAVCDPIERGTYTVSISFADDEFISTNYTITYVDGALDIVNRRVTVTATAQDFEYDGNPLNEDLLSFIHRHTTNLSETGFLNGDESLYTAEYTVTNADSGEVYSFDNIIYAGTYVVEVKLTHQDPANEDYYIDVYKTGSFTVYKRKITAAVTLTNDSKEYDKQLPDGSVFGYADYRFNSEETGFVNNDAQYAVAEYVFFDVYGNAVQPVNAGEYSVYVAGFTSENGFIESNYEYSLYSESKQFTVERRLLIIAPVGKNELYEGQSIALDSDGFKILGGSLANGDTLGNIVGSAILTPTKPQASVKIKSFEITDAEGDCSYNYEVLKAYDRNDDRLSDCKISDFTAILRYNKRTLTVVQNVPQGYKSIQYQGVPITISPDNSMFTIVQGVGDGLLNGNTVRAVAVKPFIRPGVYSSWLTVNIFDANGSNITWAYSVTYADTQDSYITVEEVALTVDVTVDISNLSDGDIVTDFLLTGTLLDGDKIELTVVATESGNTLVATVYSEYKVGTEVKRRDRSSYYKINFTGEYENVNVRSEAII